MLEPVAVEIGALCVQSTGSAFLQSWEAIRPRMSIVGHDDIFESTEFERETQSFCEEERVPMYC